MPKKKKQVNRYDDTNYAKELNNFIDLIYKKAVKEKGYDWYDLASKSGLAYQTVYNLGMRITQLPLDRTTFKLAKSVGLERHYTKKISLRKVG